MAGVRVLPMSLTRVRLPTWIIPSPHSLSRLPVPMASPKIPTTWDILCLKMGRLQLFRLPEYPGTVEEPPRSINLPMKLMNALPTPIRRVSSMTVIPLAAGVGLAMTKGNFAGVGMNAMDYNLYGEPDCFLQQTNPNQRPVAEANGPYTANEGSSVTLSGSGSFDPEGDHCSIAGTWIMMVPSIRLLLPRRLLCLPAAIILSVRSDCKFGILWGLRVKILRYSPS